jgi:hypothetical protein
LTAAAAQSATVGISQSIALGAFTDPDDDAPWQITASWGDGTTDTTFTVATAGQLPAQSHSFARTGAYTVMVQVDDGSARAHAQFMVTVSDVAEKTGSVSGIVYADANGNGNVDDGESLEGAALSLTRVSVASLNVFSATQVTGPDGAYVFSDVPEGDYSLTFTAPGYQTVTHPLTVTSGVVTDVGPTALEVTSSEEGHVTFLPALQAAVIPDVGESQVAVQTTARLLFLPIALR